MLTLDQLSALGFGCYRVCTSNPIHARSLLAALEAGCNLVDTASTYTGGDSERLVGDVLNDFGRHRAFVVTKAGYDDDAGPTGPTAHSMHPDVLLERLERSRRRLRTGTVDGFLLHNPEHHFDLPDHDGGIDAYYAQIGRAFEVLEDAVAAGHLRYYGISSNTFPLPPTAERCTSLRRVLAIAGGVSEDHHFRLAQFPFNLVERGASDSTSDGPSLIEFARSNGIVTLANRPLNALVDGTALRLSDSMDAGDVDRARDAAAFELWLEKLRHQMASRGYSQDPLDVPVLGYFAQNWMQLPGPEAVTALVHAGIRPLYDHLYGPHPPEADRAALANVVQLAVRYSIRQAVTEARHARRRLVEEGVIADDDDRPLAVIACDFGLRSGIDHVLVGMRRPEYVQQLQPLLHRRTGGNKTALRRIGGATRSSSDDRWS